MNQIPALVLFSLLIFAPVPQGFTAPQAVTVPAQVVTYDQLVRAIREARALAKTRVEEAVEREKVREAWEIGKLIDEHILQHQERADYGKRVLKRLSADLAISETELYYMTEFARSYQISPPGGKLSWSHYRVLLSVHDPKERERLAKAAVEKNWSRETLRHEIRRIRARNSAAVETFPEDRPLVPLKGALDTHRIVKLEGRLVISLGFSNYLELSGKDAKRLKEGDIVTVGARHASPLQLVRKATESLVPFQIFSYRAHVLEITDGDTLWALVDLGFGITTKQQLRLRGLDAPEIETREGQEAKKFLEKEFNVTAAEKMSKSSRAVHGAPAPCIITSTRSDKYDRYLADVWSGETYLNQKLIDAGLAVRVE